MSICIDVAIPTTIPDTTKTQLNGGSDIVLPAKAKAILAIIPWLGINAGSTADKPRMAKCSLESDDFKVTPLEVLVPPIGAGLGTGISHVLQPIPEKYVVNIPVNGGERVRVYGTGLYDADADPMMGCALVISTEPPQGAQRYGVVWPGTVASTTRLVDKTAGTKTINGGRRIVEANAIAASLVTTTTEGRIPVVKFTSSEFRPNLPLKIPLVPFSGCEVATNISDFVAGMLRYPVDIAIDNPATIEAFCTLYETTITAAPEFSAGLIYE